MSLIEIECLDGSFVLINPDHVSALYAVSCKGHYYIKMVSGQSWGINEENALKLTPTLPKYVDNTPPDIGGCLLTVGLVVSLILGLVMYLRGL